MGFNEDGPVVDMAMIQRQLALLSSLGILQGGNIVDRPPSSKALLSSPLTTTAAGWPHQPAPSVAPLVVAKTQHAAEHRMPLVRTWRAWQEVVARARRKRRVAGPGRSRRLQRYLFGWCTYVARIREAHDRTTALLAWRLHHAVAQWTRHVQRAHRLEAIELQLCGRLRLQPRRLLARVFAKLHRHRQRHAAIRILAAVRQSCRAQVVWRLLRWNVLHARVCIRLLALAFPAWANATDAQVQKTHASMAARRAMIDWRVHASVGRWSHWTRQRRFTRAVDEHMGRLRLAQACRRWRAVLVHARAASILARVHARSIQQRAFLAFVQATGAGRLLFRMHQRYLQQCMTTWKTRAMQRLVTALQMLAMDDWQCRRSVRRWQHHVAHQQRQRHAVQWANTTFLQRHWQLWSRCLARNHHSWRRVQTWSTHKTMHRAFQSWHACLYELRRQRQQMHRAVGFHQRRRQRQHFALWRAYLAHRKHNAQARTIATQFCRHQRLRAGIAALWMRQHRDRDVRIWYRAATQWHQRALRLRMLRKWRQHVAWMLRMGERLDAFQTRRPRHAYWFRLWQAATLEQRLEHLGDAWCRQRRLSLVWHRWREGVQQQQQKRFQRSKVLRWQLRRSIQHWRQHTIITDQSRRRLDRFGRRRARHMLCVYWQTWRRRARVQRAVRQRGAVVHAQVQRRIAIASYVVWRRVFCQWQLARLNAHRCARRRLRQVLTEWRSYVHRQIHAQRIVSSLVAQRHRESMSRALCLWRRYRLCVRQSAVAAWIGHRGRIRRVLRRWKAVWTQRRCIVVWHCWAGHQSRTAVVSGRQRLEWYRRRQQSWLRACFRTWQSLLATKDAYLDARMQIQLVCLSELVTRVRHRAAADMYFVLARFRHWQRVATRGKRIADHHRLMRRVRPVLVGWWKLVLQAKQTYLVDQTRAMMRRHRRTGATLRSVVDTTPSLSTYGERYLQQRMAPGRVRVRRLEPTPMPPPPTDSRLPLTTSEALPIPLWEAANGVDASVSDCDDATYAPSPPRREVHSRTLTLEDLAALSNSHTSRTSEPASSPNTLEHTKASPLAHSSAGSSTSSMHLYMLMNADDDIMPQLPPEPTPASPLQDAWCDVSCLQPAMSPRHTYDVDGPSLPSVVDEPPVVLEKKDPGTIDDQAVAALFAKHRRRLEGLFHAHASANTLGLAPFLLLAKANGLFPALFTRRELSTSFEAAASPATTLTSRTFLRCLHQIAQLLLRDSPDATPSQRLQALLLVLDGHGSALQKPIAVEPSCTTSTARQEASRARVDAILAKVATKRLAKHRENPICSSPRRRSPRWTRGPLDDVYAATPAKMTPSVLAQAMEKAQLRLLRRNLATRTALRRYEAPRQDADDEVCVNLPSSLGRSRHDMGNHFSSFELSTLE